jgi:hypothetical protein
MHAKDEQVIVSTAGNTKAEAEYVEKSNSYAEEALKPIAQGNADHTGALAKTDPEEIALVRKIDWRLMVWRSLTP